MDSVTKKRLGQYFSGDKVAELLTSLCVLSGDETIIDPMAGVGDMLCAAIGFGALPANVYGIEIDANAAKVCNKKIPGGRVIVGDAFSLSSYYSLEETSWDAVITNPPYVRYQSLNNDSSNYNGIKLKNATEVRNSLSQIIDKLPHLTIEEKACFRRIIKHYSGLSDLAVPSWLLCAALVKHGGVLAMVVPESWMNRDYALSIKYMLLKFFNIKYIVEDVEAAWFSDALVKTNLIVAQRAGFRGDFLNAGEEPYKHIKLSASLAGASSLVENLVSGDKTGLEALCNIISKDCVMEGIEIRSVFTTDFISTMQTSSAFNRLIKKLEPDIQQKNTTSIPVEVRNALKYNVSQSNIANLSDWGVQIGQGLRTGANKFFYTEIVGSDVDGIDLLRIDSLIGSNAVAVAQKYTMPVLRYQADANDKYIVTSDMLPHRLLYIQEDLFDDNNKLKNTEDAQLSNYITAADAVTFKIRDNVTRFRDLSAVKPNIRKTGQVRHWYMLPELAKRHLPQLCITRVNYKSPRCLRVDNGIVVDANFSTLWTEPKDEQIMYAIFAFMNSSWVQACLESTATVMGGGALKVEASHLRSMPIPKPTEKLISALYVLGKQIVGINTKYHDDILLEIDEIVLNDGFGVVNQLPYRKMLREFVDAKEMSRIRREIGK